MDNNNYNNPNSYNNYTNNTDNANNTNNTNATNPYYSKEYNSPNFNPYMQQSQTPPVQKKKKSGFGTTLAKTVAVAVVFGLVASAVFTGVSYTANKVLGISASASSDTSKSDTGKKANEYDQSGSISQTSTGEAKELTDVSSLVDAVMPSIVSITNTATVNYQSFWGRSESYEQDSAGSGFIIDQDDKYLYIATNNHVVSGSESLKVQFCDEKVVEAEVQGTVPSNDLAVIKVALEDIESDTLSSIKVATVGDSDALLVGEASIAIGNALGYGQSVTTGVISALGRTITTQDETTGATITNNNLIQTDAAINPGNSGGALLNSKGEVIGINSVKYASTEVEGIGYAIAINDAMPILESLIENGEYVNTQAAYLGIQGGDVSTDMTAFNIPAGVYISSVMSGSGADKAGLLEGDIITRFEGTQISSMAELQSLLQGYKAGDEVTITVARQAGQGYQETDVKVTLSSKSDLEEAGSANDNSDVEDSDNGNSEQEKSGKKDKR